MKTAVSLFGLSSRYVGGSETYARELSQQLAAHGWQSVLCFLEEPTDAVLRYLDLPNVRIEVIRNAVEPNMLALRDLIRVLRTYQPEVFHMQLVGFVGFYPWTARLLGANKIFFTDQGSHPGDYVPHRAPFWKRMAVRVINWPLSKVICISRYNHSCFSMLDILPANRSEVIYNSADFTRLGDSAERRARFRTHYGIPNDVTVILQVSWIIPEKGITDLLDAFSLVLDRNQKAHLVLVGDGAYRDEYTARAKERGLDRHTTWTGLITDPFAEGAYDGADVVCQVSRWQEAFGQTIAEAMACGKPVIGTRVGGIPELIDDGHSGFLVERGDVRGIAAKLLLLLADGALAKRMGQAGHELAKQKFQLRENVAKVLELYEISPSVS